MYFVCAGIGFLSVVLLYPLPETKDDVLEDVIEDRRQTKGQSNIKLNEIDQWRRV